ncbi:MAG: redoxin domain-containing protein [Myxococcales bacterium]|nr:redoxin domain-containing protein [Myxococcales bacterium]
MTITKQALVSAGPDFAPSGNWIHLDRDSLSVKDLSGNVVLVFFWDYSNLFCLEALHYIRAWQTQYADLPFRVVGVHSPEFPFARSAVAVRNALANLQIGFPVLLDNNRETWTAFGNLIWPAFYIMNASGAVVYKEYGEGNYHCIEAVIQDLLHELVPDRRLPPPVDALRPRDEPGVSTWSCTPVVHTGYQNGSIGNEEGFDPHRVVEYSPHRGTMVEGKFYLEGKWLNHRYCIAVAKGHDSNDAAVIVPYTAAEVVMIVNPSGDNGFAATITDGGACIRPEFVGEDIRVSGEGSERRTEIVVHEPRVYRLIKHDRVRSGVLRVECRSSGFTLYGFQFLGSPQHDTFELPVAMKELLEHKAFAQPPVMLTEEEPKKRKRSKPKQEPVEKVTPVPVKSQKRGSSKTKGVTILPDEVPVVAPQAPETPVLVEKKPRKSKPKLDVSPVVQPNKMGADAPKVIKKRAKAVPVRMSEADALMVESLKGIAKLKPSKKTKAAKVVVPLKPVTTKKAKTAPKVVEPPVKKVRSKRSGRRQGIVGMDETAASVLRTKAGKPPRIVIGRDG